MLGDIMPRPFDPLNPLISGSGTIIGPEGPAGPPGPAANFPIPLQIFSGDKSTTETSPVRFGAVRLDLASFPAQNTSGLQRQISIVYNFETTSAAAVGTARLRNVDEDEVITGSTLTTVSLINEEKRSTLTIGAGSGEIRSNRVYEVAVFKTGGVNEDAITLTNAKFEIFYV